MKQMMKNWNFKHIPMKTIALFFASATFLLLLDSCKNCPEDFQLEKDFHIGFQMLDDVSGENLLQIASRYHRDSTRVYDEEGNLVYPGPAPGNGLIAFSPLLPNEKFELGKAKEQFFYLSLFDYATKTTDIDTFRLEYSVYMDDCDEKAFSYLTIMENLSLIKKAGRKISMWSYINNTKT